MGKFNLEMTTRERMLRTYRHEEIDRMLLVDSAWTGTIKRWQNEGLPKGVDWRDYFGYDRIECIFPDNSPLFPVKVIEENERYKITTTAWGETMKTFRELDSTPESLDFYYNTPERWLEAKNKMLSYNDSRIPWAYLKENYPKWKERGDFLQLGVWFGFDVTHSHMLGTENMLVAMYDDVEWVKDMFDTYLSTSLDLCQRILDAGYEFDGAFWYDDMGYKGTTFFSKQMYRDLLKPYHKKVIDWAHERGMVTELHSCGYIEPLLPDLIEIGLEMLNPLEVKAGMEPSRIKSLFGKELAFHGGINAQLMSDKERVLEEMRKIIPIMKNGGGYVFASDHSIPNSVSFENMQAIASLAKELGKY